MQPTKIPNRKSTKQQHNTTKQQNNQNNKTAKQQNNQTNQDKPAKTSKNQHKPDCLLQ
jgi:hypothetical protein